MVKLKRHYITVYLTALVIFFGGTLLGTAVLGVIKVAKNPSDAEWLSVLFGIENGSGSIWPYFFLWMAVVALFTVISCYFLVRSMERMVSEPVRDLKLAADRITEGEYDAEIVGSDDKEVNELCCSLNRMRLELREKTAAEKEALADRSLLIANVSHDMRTPLTTIAGYIQAIEDGVISTPEQLEECRSVIRVKTEFLQHLAGDITEYSDAESGRLIYSFETVELNAFLEDMREEYSDEMERAGIPFEVCLPCSPVYIRADRARLGRVLQNLLTNAVKYNKEGGGITVFLESRTPLCYITVADGGVGISAAARNKVFDSFYREDDVRNTAGGHGLGLAIARQIVEAHHGKIWLQSTKGEGTAVYLCFPLTEES